MDGTAALLAPTGTLRAAINLGNPILAGTDAAGAPAGVSVDLARALAARLGVALDLHTFPAAAQSVAAVTEGRCDVGFFAIDPVRGAGIAYSAPYVLIEGWYAVPQGSGIVDHAGVDQPGVKVAVGKGSAYDLYLSRTLQRAEIVRAPTSPAVFDLYLDAGLDVAAGVRQQLEQAMALHPGHRLLPGRFMVIEQAMGVARSRGEAAQRALAAFVEAVKADGSVAQALQRHRIEGVSVAP